MSNNYKLQFGGMDIELDGDGLLWLPQKRLLVVSDIHFEKSTFFNRFGTFLPPYDSLNDLQKLKSKITEYQPKTLVALGDSFQDVQALERMKETERRILDEIISNVGEWVWITGNHDPVIENNSGIYLKQHFCDDICFTHIADKKSEVYEVSGHYHPKVKVNILGQSISAPCFLITDKKIIMPSFGSFTGGMFINTPTINALMPIEQRKIFAIKQGKVFKVSDS